METIMKERKLTEWGNIWINEKYFMRAYQALNRLDLETRKEAIEIATKYPCSAEHVFIGVKGHSVRCVRVKLLLFDKIRRR